MEVLRRMRSTAQRPAGLTTVGTTLANGAGLDPGSALFPPAEPARLSHPPMRMLSAFLLAAALCTACDRSPAAREVGTVAVEVPESVLVRRAAALGLPAGVTLRTAAEGGRLYDGSCIACHGPAGEGTQLGPSLADSVRIHTDGSFEETFEVIRAGVAEPREFPVPMPPLGGGRYDEEQVRALAAYVLTLKGER